MAYYKILSIQKTKEYNYQEFTNFINALIVRTGLKASASKSDIDEPTIIHSTKKLFCEIYDSYKRYSNHGSYQIKFNLKSGQLTITANIHKNFKDDFKRGVIYLKYKDFVPGILTDANIEEIAKFIEMSSKSISVELVSQD